MEPCRLCPWNSPGKNTRKGYHLLLQGIFLTQRSNPSLLHPHTDWQLESLPPGHLGNPLCLALGLKKDCLLDNSRANHDSITLMANQVVHFTPMAWSFLTPAMWEGRIIHPHPMSHLPLPFHHLPVWDSGLSATCRGRYRQSIHNVYTVWELSFHPKQKALAAWL